MNRTDSKSVVPLAVPRVRIPLSPISSLAMIFKCFVVIPSLIPSGPEGSSGTHWSIVLNYLEGAKEVFFITDLEIESVYVIL